jgi:hypothetical protein
VVPGGTIGDIRGEDVQGILRVTRSSLTQMLCLLALKVRSETTLHFLVGGSLPASTSKQFRRGGYFQIDGHKHRAQLSGKRRW